MLLWTLIYTGPNSIKEAANTRQPCKARRMIEVRLVPNTVSYTDERMKQRSKSSCRRRRRCVIQSAQCLRTLTTALRSATLIMRTILKPTDALPPQRLLSHSDD